MAQHSDLLSKLLSNIEVIDRGGERDRQTEGERETEREREKESLFHLFWNSLTSKAQSILFSLLSSVNTILKCLPYTIKIQLLFTIILNYGV